MPAPGRTAIVASLCAGLMIAAATHPAARPATVETHALDQEIRSFLQRELTAHLAPIRTLDPAPERVNGALTVGEFSWGTFMRSLAAYAQLEGASRLADRDLARAIGDIGLLEVRLGGTRFSQLYAALSLRHFGSELATNRLWQALTPDERDAWRTLLDPTRFYDPVTRQVIDLPENYLGVAARIAAVAWETRLLTDRALLDSLLDRAAVQFTTGALYADDALPAGRYDRYSNEYARYVWDAARIAGRDDLLDALRPSLRAQMRLWWDLLAPDGYGYPWGRSIGAIGYMDTLEIAGFLAVTPEFRPAPLDRIVGAYNAAWRWLRSDYRDDRHLLSVFDFGRGNFAYITREREWQQSTGFLGKLGEAHRHFMTGLRDARLDAAPAAPDLPAVARYEAFRTTGRQAGVWIVRQPELQFALPITTGTKPGAADYLPAPHGFPGVAAPVEQVVPALVPFLELEDGRTIAAADGADRIEPGADARSLTATWTRWALIGGKPGALVDPGITAVVEWTLRGSTLTRVEHLTASRPVAVRSWRLIVPATGDRWATRRTDRMREDDIVGRDGRLSIAVAHSDWPVTIAGRATGDSPDGRGARGAIPFHLTLEARDIRLQPGTPRGWTLRLDAH
jgi:hypothetical protein